MLEQTKNQLQKVDQWNFQNNIFLFLTIHRKLQIA